MRLQSSSLHMATLTSNLDLSVLYDFNFIILSLQGFERGLQYQPLSGHKTLIFTNTWGLLLGHLVSVSVGHTFLYSTFNSIYDVPFYLKDVDNCPLISNIWTHTIENSNKQYENSMLLFFYINRWNVNKFILQILIYWFQNICGIHVFGIFDINMSNKEWNGTTY